MAVPSPSSPEQERAARRRPAPAARLRAQPDAGAARRARGASWRGSSCRISLGARVVAAYHPLRTRSAPSRSSPASATGSAPAFPGSPTATPDALARGAGDRAEPVGRAPAAGRGRGAGARHRAGPAGRSPTGAAPGSATARAITTARSPICAKAAARLHHRPRAGRARSSTSRSRPTLGHEARRDRDAGGMDPMRLEPTWRQPVGIAADPAADRRLGVARRQRGAADRRPRPGRSTRFIIWSPGSSGSCRSSRCCAGWRRALACRRRERKWRE